MQKSLHHDSDVFRCGGSPGFCKSFPRVRNQPQSLLAETQTETRTETETETRRPSYEETLLDHFPLLQQRHRLLVVQLFHFYDSTALTPLVCDDEEVLPPFVCCCEWRRYRRVVTGGKAVYTFCGASGFAS